MTSINDTVTTALNNTGLRQYAAQAQPVVDALVQREQNIVDTLLNAAEEQGLSRADAIRVFQGAGMEVPGQMEAAAAPDADGDVLTEIRDALRGLTEFARANGYRG